jgi:hypothetical protein
MQRTVPLPVQLPAGKNFERPDAKLKKPPQARGRIKTKETSMPIAHTLQKHTAAYQHATSSSNGHVSPAPADWRDARYQAFALLRIAFTVAPIAFGLDKFFNVLVHWPNYLAPWINDTAPGTGQQFMYFVGGTEILAGLIVALKPRYGAYVVAAWLGGIIINLLTYSGFYDIALRDFGLMLAALTLARLASVYDRPLRLRRH